VALIGTLDTKHDEVAYLQARLQEQGCDVIVIDAGVFEHRGGPLVPDVPAEVVARAAGTSLQELRALADRGRAVEAMGAGARAVVADLLGSGRCDGLLAVGGSGNASIAASAMEGLPIGMPKLLVSTIAAGDTRPYIGAHDIALMYPVVDIAGLNWVTRPVFDNAAAAMAAMAKTATTHLGNARVGNAPPGTHRAHVTTSIAATMFGVTTAGVDRCRRRLEQLGHEVLVFHASGHGGRTMESLVDDGLFSAVCDITTTELADELVGGVCTAGPHRLEAAVAKGLPQVVSTGALDMVNFGPISTVPERFAGRRLYRHNQNVTLMRTEPDECEVLGQTMARKLNATTAPVKIFAPVRGLSAISVPGGVFHYPEADQALLEGLVRAVENPLIELEEIDCDINDAGLADRMADQMDRMVRATPLTAPN
jgi:uncharacterized protein (UPF0261 family)